MTTGIVPPASYVEVLLQDDASPDYDLREMVGWPPFKVARNDENMGFIRNVNEAAKRARGDILCIMNQDIQCTQRDWHLPMMALLNNPQVGIVGPKLVFPEGGIQSCGGLFDIGKGPFHRYLGWRDVNDRRVNTTEKVSWITGACFMIRRSDFWKLGGLDDIYYTRAYFEDVDLCMKMRLDINKDVMYCAESTLIHSVGSTGGSPYFQRNSIAFHKRWDSRIEPDVQTMEVNY